MTTDETTRLAPAQPFKLERILVPVDFSLAGQGALDRAITLASKFAARIILIHVVEVICGPQDPAYGYFPGDDALQVTVATRRLIEFGAQKIPAALLETTLVRHGVPYHAITTAARELKTDLIVITTHGRTGLNHILMGSTAERIVRHAPCDVLTVRRTGSDATAKEAR